MADRERLSIKQLAQLAGVSVRTLHYYDQIGLLVPQRNRENNYRFYTHQSLLQLQQIMFYREMEFGLEEIAAIVNRPDFDQVRALEAHHEALTDKAKRLQTLLETIERTINNLKGKNAMSQTQYFTGFSDEQQAEYEKQAAELWDPEVVHESNRKWRQMSQAEKDALMANGERITTDLFHAMPKGASDPEVQKLVAEWHSHLGSFYDCSVEILLGLRHLYVEDSRFKAFYDRIHPDLANFLYDAIKVYCAANGVTEQE